MKWKKFRLSTTEAAEDIVIATLADCGIEGVEIVDKAPLTEEEKQQMFVDIPPQAQEDDGIAQLFFYLDPESDWETEIARVREELDSLREFMDIGSGAIDISETEDVDWINNWKQYFKQFTIDGDILVVPSWEEIREEDRNKMVLHIDPGTAFGTGMHETTQLCIRQLKKHVKPGWEILDVGTGSGILSIIACKLGAGHAVGTDLDPCAVPAVQENCEANGLTERQIFLDDTGENEGESAGERNAEENLCSDKPAQMELLLGNLIDDEAVQERVGREKYDIVLANILADILVPLMPAAAAAMKPGGVCILSGILEGQEQKVISAAERAGLRLDEITHNGEWVGVTCRK